MISLLNFTTSTQKNGELLPVSCKIEMKISAFIDIGDCRSWEHIRKYGPPKKTKPFYRSLRRSAKIGNFWPRSWEPRQANRSEKDSSTNLILKSKLMNGQMKRTNLFSSTTLSLGADGLR